VALLQRREIIQQDERRRIARDVHDHLGQQMTALRMQLELLQGYVDPTRPFSHRLRRSSVSPKGSIEALMT
jgi:signal transduction histidine kinase